MGDLLTVRHCDVISKKVNTPHEEDCFCKGTVTWELCRVFVDNNRVFPLFRLEIALLQCCQILSLKRYLLYISKVYASALAVLKSAKVFLSCALKHFWSAFNVALMRFKVTPLHVRVVMPNTGRRPEWRIQLRVITVHLHTTWPHLYSEHFWRLI